MRPRDDPCAGDGRVGAGTEVDASEKEIACGYPGAAC